MTDGDTGPDGTSRGRSGRGPRRGRGGAARVARGSVTALGHGSAARGPRSCSPVSGRAGPVRGTGYLSQFQAHCYTDILRYFREGLSSGRFPTPATRVEYPVLIGGAMQLVSSPGWSTPSATRSPGAWSSSSSPSSCSRCSRSACWPRPTSRAAPAGGPLRAGPGGGRVHQLGPDRDGPGHGGNGSLAARRGVLAGVLLGLAGAATKFYPLLSATAAACARAGSASSG